jgi:hypothetical protein
MNDAVPVKQAISSTAISMRRRLANRTCAPRRDHRRHGAREQPD